jgi:hypothetical protein
MSDTSGDNQAPVSALNFVSNYCVDIPARPDSVAFCTFLAARFAGPLFALGLDQTNAHAQVKQPLNYRTEER